MTELVAPPGLVARLRLEHDGEVVERGVGDRLDEVRLQIGERPHAHRAAEALDRPDPGECGDHRLAHAALEQEPRLRDVR